MNTFAKVLKFLGCVVGGAVSASVILIVVGVCIYGFRDTDRIGGFLTAANPIVGVLGAAAGAVIYFRSARYPARP